MKENIMLHFNDFCRASGNEKFITKFSALN